MRPTLHVMKRILLMHVVLVIVGAFVSFAGCATGVTSPGPEGEYANGVQSRDLKFARQVRAARKLTKSGHFSEAFEAFENLIERRPRDLSAHRGLVEASYFNGRLHEEQEYYSSMSKSGSMRGIGFYGLALVAVAQGPGHMKAALEYFKKAAQMMPHEADVPYRIGLVLMMNGENKKALGFLTKALSMDPDFISVRIALGKCLSELGETKRAIETMRPIVGRELTPEQAKKALAVAEMIFNPQRDLPVELSAEINKVLDLMSNDAIQPALTQIDSLAKRFPDVAMVFSLRGLLHSRMENDAESIVAFEHALSLKPNDPFSLVGLGDVYMSLQKWEKARRYYEQALGVNPLDLDAYERLGSMALKLGDMDRAAHAYEMLMLLQPDSIDAKHQYAEVLFRAGRLDEAIGLYKSILSMDKDNLIALIRLAKTHLTIGKIKPETMSVHKKEAKKLLEKAKDLAPENEAVKEMLSSLND